MRPHEEEWELEAPSPDGCIRVIAKGKKGEALALTPERARLLVAAPDMARALIHVLNSSVNERTWNEETGKVDDMKTIVRAALIKAGVL